MWSQKVISKAMHWITGVESMLVSFSPHDKNTWEYTFKIGKVFWSSFQGFSVGLLDHFQLVGAHFMMARPCSKVMSSPHDSREAEVNGQDLSVPFGASPQWPSAFQLGPAYESTSTNLSAALQTGNQAC